ncbi:hypothetical protein [Aliiroseovarius sp. PTFE2010]
MSIVGHGQISVPADITLADENTGLKVRPAKIVVVRPWWWL